MLKGGYVAKAEEGELRLILLSSGSELHLAMQAAAKIGAGVRVVSMPCMERFIRQDESYRESVLPSACAKRISIEAGVSQPWFRFVGPAGRVLAIDRFGLSAPGGTVMKELGISVDALVAAAAELLGEA